MNTHSKGTPPAKPQPAKAALRTLQSREILANAQEVIIEHEGDHYRLRCTSKGKLILTK